MRGLDNSAADYACLTNDIFSYQKEIEFEGELNNGVLVVQRFLDCDLEQAVDVVNDLMTARMQQFEHIVATELPALFDEFDLDDRPAKSSTLRREASTVDVRRAEVAPRAGATTSPPCATRPRPGDCFTASEGWAPRLRVSGRWSAP